MKTLILLTFILFSKLSFATGETYCSVETDQIKIQVILLNSHTPGSSVLEGEALVTIKNQEIRLKSEDLVGWWNLNNELKMHFIQFAQGNDQRDSQLIITTNYSDVHEIYLGVARFEGLQGEIFSEITQCETN